MFPVWTGAPMIRNQRSSWDGGISYLPEKDQILYGTHFFLSEEIIEHQFQAYKIIDLLAALGGFASFIVVGLRFIGKHINRQVIAAKFIRGMYFIKKNEKNNLFNILKRDVTDSLTPIHVTLWNKIFNCRPTEKKRINDGDID